MRDTFQRDIRYLRLSVTDLCNLRCRYCMPAEGVVKKSHAEMLSEEEMVAAVRAAASLGFTKVRLTGGEPLIKPNILSLSAKVAAVPGIREVCMTTNGLLLPRYAADLRAAGVRRINLSLDTLDPKKYAAITRGGKLEDALGGLDAALNGGFDKVKINVVLLGGFNDDEIGALAELTVRYPVDVRFIEWMPILDEAPCPGDVRRTCDTVLEALPELEPISGDGGVAELYRLPGAQGAVGLIRPLSHRFCDRCNRLRLTADGQLKPCLLSSDEFGIKGLDEAGMRRQMIRAIRSKPRCHGPLTGAHPARPGRTMNRIGG